MSNLEKRDILLAIAERVLMNRGLTGTTIEAIAAEAGMTKGWIFHYFPSKRDIILGIIDRFKVHLEQERAGVMAKMPDTPTRFLKATILTMLKYRQGNHGMIINLGGLMDVEEYRDRIAALKVGIFDEIVEHFPHPEKVAMALVIVDGLWMNNSFTTPVYYPGCTRTIEQALLEEIDAMST